MKIAFVSTEAVPYAKTGGLADVAGSLPKALEKLGCEVKLFIPKYNIIDETRFGLRYNWGIGEMPIRVAGHVRSVHVHQAKLNNSNVEVNFIDCPHFFHRGNLYTNDKDEDERFILFCKAVIETLQRLQWKPDVIHCNDWQTGLIPLYVKDNYNWDKIFDRIAVVYTIHNVGYQGRFSESAMFKAELRGEYFYPGGPVELEGSVSFMKTGILFSEIISTVSNTYAKEILTPEYGAGMESVLKSRVKDLYGIINGVDYDIWNPETDKHLPFHYSVDDLSGKIKNKEFLLNHFNIPFDQNIPLIGLVSRLVGQKGFDLIAKAANELMSLDAQWIVLGSGEERFEDLFRSLAHAFPGKFGAYIGFNTELSHLIEAGADMFLMPSHYEPCGLNQIYSLRYGTVPIVRKTGGLADTVFDWHEFKNYGFESGTGFSFNDATPFALYSAVRRSIDTFHDKEVWKKIRKNGMMMDFSWERSASDYIKLYERAVAKRSSAP